MSHKLHKQSNINTVLFFLFFTECYRLDRSGTRHETTSYRDALNVKDRSECLLECQRTQYCFSFSYQYSFSGSSSRNCLLSRSQVRDLTSVDLRVDSNWDLYEYLESGGYNCRRNSGGGNTVDGKLNAFLYTV